MDLKENGIKNEHFRYIPIQNILFDQGMTKKVNEICGDNAKKIGFLIDTPNANILKIGNSALNGAIIFLVNVDERIKIESIVKTIKHVELETDVNFFDHFVEGCQFKELKVM